MSINRENKVTGSGTTSEAYPKKKFFGTIGIDNLNKVISGRTS